MGSSALSDDKQQAAQLERLLEFYSPDEIPPEPTSALHRIPYNITTGRLISNALLQADVHCVVIGGSLLKWCHANYEQFMMACIFLNTCFTLSQVLCPC